MGNAKIKCAMSHTMDARHNPSPPLHSQGKRWHLDLARTDVQTWDHGEIKTLP